MPEYTGYAHRCIMLNRIIDALQAQKESRRSPPGLPQRFLDATYPGDVMRYTLMETFHDRCAGLILMIDSKGASAQPNPIPLMVLIVYNPDQVYLGSFHQITNASELTRVDGLWTRVKQDGFLGALSTNQQLRDMIAIYSVRMKGMDAFTSEQQQAGGQQSGQAFVAMEARRNIQSLQNTMKMSVPGLKYPSENIPDQDALDRRLRPTKAAMTDVSGTNC